MESYYICTSHGTFNFQLKKKGKEGEETWEIAPRCKTFMETAIQSMFPGTTYEIVENDEGLFVRILDSNATVVPEYKLFKSSRKDFELEPQPIEPAGWLDWCTII